MYYVRHYNSVHVVPLISFANYQKYRLKDIPLFPGISLILQAAFCSEYMLLSENCWYLYPMAILGFLMGFILTSM